MDDEVFVAHRGALSKGKTDEVRISLADNNNHFQSRRSFRGSPVLPYRMARKTRDGRNEKYKLAVDYYRLLEPLTEGAFKPSDDNKTAPDQYRYYARSV